MAYHLGARPRVVNIHLAAELFQLRSNIYDLGVAAVGAVLLEGHTQHEHVSVLNLMVLLNHQFQHLVGNELGDRVIHSSAAENHLRVVAQRLCFVGKVVGVNRDAMAAYQARTIFQEVPFCTGGFDDVVGVDTYAVADESQFVHERDIHIALAVLHSLGGLCHLHVGGTMGAIEQDGVVHRIHQVGYFGCRTRGDLLDLGQRVDLVTRVDSFRRIAAEEVHVELQARELLQHGYAVFLGAARIDGALVDDDVAAVQGLADGLACFEQGC